MENQVKKGRKCKELTPEEAYEKYLKTREYHKNYVEIPEVKEKKLLYRKEYSQTDKYREYHRKYEREKYQKNKGKLPVKYTFTFTPEKNEEEEFLNRLSELCEELKVKYEQKQLGRKPLQIPSEIPA